MSRSHCWWQDADGFIREGLLTTEHEASDGELPVLVAYDDTVLRPAEMAGIRIHLHGTAEHVVRMRELARRAGYDVVDR